MLDKDTKRTYNIFTVTIVTQWDIIKNNGRRNYMTNNISIEHKYNLTVKEAAEYFNIGENKLREITDRNDCPFVLWVGSKRLIKRLTLEKYLEKQYSV